MYLLSLADPDIQLGGTDPNIRPLPLSRHGTVTYYVKFSFAICLYYCWISFFFISDNLTSQRHHSR